MSRSPEHRKGVATLPARLSPTFVSTPLASSWPPPAAIPTKKSSISRARHGSTPQLYARMQAFVQQMLHSEHGVPIRSHKRRLISAIPSVFTGTDMVQWLMKNLSLDSKAEAIHIANMLARHGFFFCVEGLGIPVRDDGTLYRFQTPYYWPSQNPADSDFEYGLYLVKQVLRSKHKIRLLDYEMNNLHKLKLRLAKEWKAITDKADEDVKIFREQKRVAKVIIGSQEEAFWRLYRPPPGEGGVGDSLLTRHYTERPEWYPLNPSPMDIATKSHEGLLQSLQWTEQSLRAEVDFMQQKLKMPRLHMSTALEGLVTYCHKYSDFDPMITPPVPGNPWITGDEMLWTVEKSLLEHPTERQVRKWGCSFQDLLTDVTGRYKFEGFCKGQYCLENIRFWQACRDLKSIPLLAVEGAVTLIYDEFLQRGATSEVNVSANVQEVVEQDLKTSSRYAFTAAQDQIYLLMQNDIYPRFIKSEGYKSMLKQAIAMATQGKGFFSRLYTGRRNKLVAQTRDATGISPNLPQRFTKRQLSISRKLSSSAGSSASLDDLFLATSSSSHDSSFNNRKSAYTEAFIDAITSPNPQSTSQVLRYRRVSAPTPAASLGKKFRNASHGSSGGSLEQVFEEEEGGGSQLPILDESMSGVPMSYSADDLTQLQENADLIQPSKWKHLATTELGQSRSPSSAHTMDHLVVNGVMPTSRSIPYQLSEQKNELLQVPNFVVSSSPRVQSFEFESIDKRCSSTESINSTHST